MKMNKNLTRLLCGLLCLCLCLSACKKEEPGTTTGAVENPKDAIYTISLKSAGGMPFGGLVVYVYEDATEDDLLTYGTLDSNGSFTFTATESDKYTVRFMGLPEEGYDVQEYYPITSTDTEIVLTSAPTAGKDVLEAGKVYQLGDVMRDFTVTTVDGEELTLSKILKEKQAVVLNFWYTGCGPCKSEFPLLQAAYEAYSDKIEVITMNPTDISGDNAEKIMAFRDQFGLTMPMATCSGKWFDALGVRSYPTTVIIDRYGMVCLITASSVDEQGAFEAAFEHFTAADYEQKLLSGFDELFNVEYAVGHPKNPYETFGGVGEFEVNVEAGAQFYTVIYKANGILLHIENPNAYVIYEDVRYEPDKKGVIEVLIQTGDVNLGANVVIGNTGDTAATIKVQTLIPKGTASNPYEGSLGEYNVTVEAGNDQGVYYEWTATEAGTFVMTLTNEPKEAFDIQLYNLNTYAVRSLQSDEQVDEDGNRYVSVDVNEGDVVRISFGSLPDASFNYPKVTIKAVASFQEDDGDMPIYTLTIRDDSGNPIAGVKVTVVVDGVDAVFVSDENGLVEMELPSGIYTVKVTVPEGYVCENNQFLLSPSNPDKDVVLAVYVPREIPYTIYIVDELGQPVADAAVVLGDYFVYSDANGMVGFILLESEEYVITVVPPTGYTIPESTFAFGSETTLTIVVYQEVEEEKKAEYTVKVEGPDGKPYTDLLVRFDSEDGSISVTDSVNAEGTVTVNLPETSYRVTLLFNAGATMGYETTTAKLTPGKTTLTIEVAPYLSGATKSIYVNGVDYDAYIIEQSDVYVDLTDKEIVYFLFTPEQTGVFKITTTNANAPISFWNSPFFPFDCSDSYVKNNVCTLEVKNVGPTYVLAVKGGDGITGTILKIAKTGSAVQDEIPREIYEGNPPKTPFQFNDAGSKKYLDLAATNTLVKGSDGFYHWGSEDGEIVYMDLINARFGISIAELVDVTSMHKYEHDNNGKPVKRIDYTECMISYVQNVDATHGVYALTDDLITILQEHGKYVGWYDSDSQSYLFAGEDVLPENAWMFLLCTFE